MYIIVW